MRIDEIYCRAIRAAGSHGTWEPGYGVWPGDYGEYHRGIFKRLGCLSSRGYTYRVGSDQQATLVITSERVGARAFSASGDLSDPVQIIAAANGRVRFEFSDENEVAFMTAPGTWHRVVDVEDVLAQVQRKIETWPTSRLILCRVFETYTGIAAVSTGASQAVDIGVGAKGTVHGAAKVGVDLGFSSSWSQSTGWTSPFSSPAELSTEPCQRSLESTPLFGDGYRVRRRYWDIFGPRTIADIDGNVIKVDPALLERHKEMSETERGDAIAGLKSLPVFELFELLEPQTVNEELDEELGVPVRAGA